jgi:hypothetical protein
VFLFFGVLLWLLAIGACYLVFLALVVPYGSPGRIGVIVFLVLFAILAVFAGLQGVRLGIRG